MDDTTGESTAGGTRTSYAAAAVVACLAVVSVPVELTHVSWGPLTRDSLPVLAAALSVAASGYAALRRRGRLRRAWLLLGVMILLNTLGAAQWLAHGGSQNERILSWSDVLSTRSRFHIICHRQC